MAAFLQSTTGRCASWVRREERAENNLKCSREMSTSDRKHLTANGYKTRDAREPAAAGTGAKRTRTTSRSDTRNPASCRFLAKKPVYAPYLRLPAILYVRSDPDVSASAAG